MHVQPQRVTHAVHEILLQRRLLRILLLDVLLRNQPQLQQLHLGQFLRLTLPILRQFARHQILDAPAQHPQHRIIDFPLTLRELPAHRNRPRQVRIIIRISRRHIQQQHVPLFAHRIVIQIVQHVRIVPRRNDRVVRKPPALPDEFMRQLGLDLELMHARPHKPQQPPEPIPRNPARLLQQRNLLLALHRTQLMHQLRQPMITVQRPHRHRLPHKPRLARLHHNVRTRMLIRIQKHMVRLAHQPPHHHRKLLQPHHRPHPARRTRLLLRQLVPLPHRNVLARLPQKQNLPVLLLMRIRTNHQHRLLLRHPRQIKQITVRHRNHHRIRIRRRNVVGIDHHK